MKGKKRASLRRVKSDLKRVDAHVIQPEEYEEITELTDEMFARAVWKRGGRPIPTPLRDVTLRLPVNLIAKWKATGPGWQTRMAKRLSRVSRQRTGS
jgi:uncharacterized protein (DUF4415 family)